MPNHVQSTQHRLLTARAQAMRASPTASESALWRLLRAQQLGVRPVVIGRALKFPERYPRLGRATVDGSRRHKY
jgi:very-short-patch-repair endonuclease